MMWIRYIAAMGLAVVAGSIVPIAGGDTEQLLRQVVELSLRIGRFLVFPTVFCGAVVAADELREERDLLPVILRTVSIVVLAVLGAAIIGALAVVGLQPQRIPPMLQEAAGVQLPRALPILIESIPRNAFRLFVLGEHALIPLFAFAVLLGAAFSGDREVADPLSLLVDSAGRVLFRMNRVLVGLLPLLLIAPTMLAMVQLRVRADVQLYGQLLLVVIVVAAFLVVGVYPLLITLLVGRSAVAPWLRTTVVPALTALGSGDVYVALAPAMRFGNETLGISRRTGAVALPLATVFARAGSTMVAVAGFLLVMRSYTALDIGVFQVGLIVVSAFLLSFTLGRSPAGGVLVLLSYLSLVYGRGMEESYLILLPVMPALERVAALTDAATAGAVNLLVAHRSGYWKVRGA